MRHYRLAAGLALAAACAIAPDLAAAAESLVVAIGSRGYGNVVPHDIDAFTTKNPGVTVEWQKVSDVPNETHQLYVTSLTAKSPTPDVFAVDVIWAGEFAKHGWLEPLNSYFSADELSKFNQSFLAAATLDGKVYAAPLYVDGTHLFYRKDLLDKYGLEAPKTWEELIADAKTVVDGEKNPQLYGFVSMWAKIEGLFMNWLSFVNGNGGSFFDKDGNVAVNSPAAIAATQQMVDIIYKDKIAPESILNDKPDDARTLFQQGRAVFLMVQDFVYAPLNADDSPVKGKFDFERDPYFEGHTDAHSTAMGGFLLAVNANSEHKDAAMALVKEFSSADNQLWAALNDNRSPARPDVYNSPELAGAKVLTKLGTDFSVGVVRPSAETGNLYPQVSDAMQIEITNALHQQKTAEQAMNDAATKVKSILGQ
jgi:trehalose/maltose transport system substrate-binding protein